MKKQMRFKQCRNPLSVISGGDGAGSEKRRYGEAGGNPGEAGRVVLQDLYGQRAAPRYGISAGILPQIREEASKVAVTHRRKSGGQTRKEHRFAYLKFSCKDMLKGV